MAALFIPLYLLIKIGTLLTSYFQFRRTKTKVIYSSSNFLIVNKGTDFKINSNNSKEVTVQTFLKWKYPNIANSKLYHEFYYPHRLDYATSGILCIPTNKKTCKVVSQVFSTRVARKYYIAIVRGSLSEEILDINIPIGEDIRYKDIQKMCTISEAAFCSKSRCARTVLISIEKGLFDMYPATKVLCRPITGRRHQIRVHCFSVGHTIVGDFTYSNRKDNKPPQMYLHCIRLRLPNHIEDIDIATDDPYRGIENWSSVRTLMTISAAYNKIDEFIETKI
ncbi:RNA pseudouridylate synthase domain-containing protein 1-like [Cylas formicarius]|uniref:RNA pseudouridylate synthase domain-containing protein 1-like n=1 Tax=Cylas formicarius TaxID=197179 RepID=UPI0029589CF9|nr:RNA pseudouridylate synthase domain-containing protein 1-like [Cylas formicarius]